jgi:DNA-binding transcriptional MerR regulator
LLLQNSNLRYALPMTSAALEQTLSQIVELRRVVPAVADPAERRRLERVIRQLRAGVGVGVPKLRAAALLGMSVQALERWVRHGDLPTARRPGSSRELIDAEALLLLAEEVTRLREQGQTRRLVAHALQQLLDEGRMPRKLRPNQSAAELRYEYLHTTPAERLRSAAELSTVAGTLAGAGRRNNPATAAG